MLRKFFLPVFVVLFLLASFYVVLRVEKQPKINEIVAPTQIPYPTITPAEATKIPTPTPSLILQNVPFTAQSPFAEWSDPRQQDACEEASSLMAVYWARDKKIISKEAAKTEILAISRYQEELYGEYRDTSAEDTVQIIIHGYYQYEIAGTSEIKNADEIIAILMAGGLVIAPMNGQALQNPHFKQPGPERHMLVIKGYDFRTNEFITNDPGIREGEGYRYPKEIIFEAIRDFKTGYHVPIMGVLKKVIIIRRLS